MEFDFGLPPCLGNYLLPNKEKYNMSSIFWGDTMVPNIE